MQHRLEEGWEGSEGREESIPAGVLLTRFYVRGRGVVPTGAPA